MQIGHFNDSYSAYDFRLTVGKWGTAGRWRTAGIETKHSLSLYVTKAFLVQTYIPRIGHISDN